MSQYPPSPVIFPVRSSWRREPPLGAQIDWQHPLAQELEACWLFNEGQGTQVYDTTGNGHTLTFGQGVAEGTNVAWRAAERDGPPGSALQFSETQTGGGGGTSPNIVLPVRMPGSQWAVEFWLNAYSRTIDTSTLLRSGSELGAEATFLYFLQQTATTGIVGFTGNFGNVTALTASANNLFYHVVISTEPHPTVAGQSLIQLWLNEAHIAHTTTPPGLIHWNYFGNWQSRSCFIGMIALGRIWRRALAREEVADLRRDPYGMFARRPTLRVSRRPPHPPTQMQWQAQAIRADRIVRITPARLQWRGQITPKTGSLGRVVPAQMQWQARGINRVIVVEPVRIKWQGNRQQLPVGLVLRDCGEEYEAALQRTTIGGDWLISAPAIGLFVSFNYEGGGGWEHRIVDISDIEISAPPGGGIASAANVTVSIAETGSGQSIVTLWEQASAVGAVEVTIDFLLAGAEQVLRIFTGSIDSITVKDAVAQLLLVDDSIRKNLVIPKDIITVEEYPNADQAALTKVQPLVYGQGSKIGAAPLLFVDVTNNTYLLAAHTMQLGGLLAVYDQPTKTFLTLPTIVFIPNHGNASITLGTLNQGGLQVLQHDAQGGNPGNALDGDSLTTTIVKTGLAGPFAQLEIATGDGWGYTGWGPSAPGMPLAATLKIDIFNHRRSPGSDPTVTGTFWLRTLTGGAPGWGHSRFLFVSPAFNHTTSAQHDTFILSNVNIGVNETFQILLVARCQGQVGGANQTYEVGEVSVTPLVAFSANISGTPTAIGLPINIQELRFNPQHPTLSILSTLNVTTPAFAIDGISTTLALLGTGSVDSNLDGYGEIIVTTAVTSAHRANNTVVIDLNNHRRSLASTPTVTGTFAIQTYNTATGVLLRDNLFVTPAFRHQLNPMSTSFVATAINLGATAQLAVRVVARNEGGAGGAGQYYEVGGISIETFYQPRGDSGDIFLFGEGYEGRTDLLGTVTDYIGTLPGRLYQTPDQVIASMYEDELSMSVDLESFATAYNVYTGLGLRFDGGLGAGWAIEQGDARDILDVLAKQGTAILFPTFEATWGIRPFRTDIPVHQTFDGSDILTESGSESQRAEDRLSTVQLTLGNLQNVYNHFEVRYKYNVGSRKYDSVWKVTKDGSNLPTGALDKAAIEETCLTSWLRYGDLEPLIIEANWIADDDTAAYYLRHVVLYFSQQRLAVQFETTLKAACLQVGDFIAITDNSLPSGDNGGTFEVHTIRYMPLKGRIQLVTSRVASIPDVTIPPPPTALVGCERFETTAGMLACWDFEEANGSRIDHLYEYSLTAVNNPLGVTGKVGTAIQFLRASSQYLINDDLLTGAFTGAYTLACWVRLLSVPSDAWILIGKGSNLAGGELEFFLSITSGTATVNFVAGAGSNPGGSDTVTSPTGLPFTGTVADWTLVRIWRTFDASFNGTLHLQMNNGTVTTMAFTTMLPRAFRGLTVGAGYAAPGVISYHANLAVDQLMVWPRVLTQAELDDIWNGGVG